VKSRLSIRKWQWQWWVSHVSHLARSRRAQSSLSLLNRNLSREWQW